MLKLSQLVRQVYRCLSTSGKSKPKCRGPLCVIAMVAMPVGAVSWVTDSGAAAATDLQKVVLTTLHRWHCCVRWQGQQSRE